MTRLTAELLHNSALLINECQNAMTDPAFSHNVGLAQEVVQRDVIAHIASLAAVFRSTNRKVIHNTIVPRRDFAGYTANCLLLGSLKKQGVVVAGSPAAAINPRLGPEPSDLVVNRVHGLSPFHGTELEQILRNCGVSTVVIVGVSTNIGVPGACLEAVNRGFQVVVPEDCTAGAWHEAHAFQIKNTLPLLATVTTSDEVAAAVA
jgi:nicotinamidase-related amidase